jgi:hypothetical protein
MLRYARFKKKWRAISLIMGNSFEETDVSEDFARAVYPGARELKTAEGASSTSFTRVPMRLPQVASKWSLSY